MKNARLWVLGRYCQPVKITLRPGQSLSWQTFTQTDEGWTASYERWTHECDHVANQWSSDGVDCDGRHSRAGVAFCCIERLRDGCRDFNSPDIFYPKWEEEKETQRDYSAEAMGY